MITQADILLMLTLPALGGIIAYIFLFELFGDN